MRSGHILVTGAAGFIGRHLVRDLVDHGEQVVAMVRTSPSRPISESPLVREVRGDVTDLRSVIDAARDVTRIVHLAGMTSLRGISYEAAFRTNVVGTMNVLDAARVVKAELVVVLGTQSENRGAYATTKRQADELVLASGVPHVVLRPSLVYGPDAGAVFGSVAGLVRRLPAVPLVGKGDYLMAPVFVGDVCDAIRAALAHREIESEYYLSGPQVVSFRYFVEAIARAQGIKRRFVPIPYPLVALGIGLAQRARIRLPLTSDTLQGLVHSQVYDPAAAVRDLGFRPIDLEEGLQLTFR